MFKKLLCDDYLKYNFVFFCGSMVVAFLNYLYHPVLSRMMAIESFGEVQAIISMSLLLGMVIGVFRTIVINIIANSADPKEQSEIIFMLQRLGLYAVLAMSFLIILFSPLLKTFFNFASVFPFLILPPLLFISLFLTFRSGMLQALRRFNEVSVANIIYSGGKLVFAVLLVYIGWASFGAIAAIVLAQLLALIYSYSKTRNVFAPLGNKKVRITGKIKKEMSYAFLVFSATLCATFLYSADVMVVKHYFPADTAGFYSGIATIARIIFFMNASIAGVLISFIKLGNTPEENKKTLIKSLILAGGMGGAILLTFLLVPDIMIKALIGQRYLGHAGLLPRLSILLFAVSLINLLFFYYLALRRYLIAGVSIATPIAVLVLSYFRHETLLEIINNFLLVSTVLLVFLLLVLFRPFQKQEKIHDKINFNNYPGV